MEHLHFEYQGPGARRIERPAVLVGVVSSGNLEVLIEVADRDGGCQVDVSTSASGFSTIWRAVLDDFVARHDVANLTISINDGGATPAVVGLRLDQAIEEFLRRAP